MEYENAKLTQFRLEEARRHQRNAEFARELRRPRQPMRPALRPALTRRIANWIPIRICLETRDRGAV